MVRGTSHAILRYARISPKKSKLIADMVRGKPVSQAIQTLELLPKSPSKHILKVIKSALANAINKGVEPDSLYVSYISVDRGPIMKRWLPRAYGRATPIKKRTSHISVVLDIM